MKSIKKHIYILIVACMALTMSCEDLAFGEKFLHKPPSTDVTIDTIFSTAEYARRILWYSYQKLPYGFNVSDYTTTMRIGNMEGLTDLNHDYVGYSGVQYIYYDGVYDASKENKGLLDRKASKYRFYEFGAWECIRHAWLFIENVDKVPDMTDQEKSRLKAEAKTIIAIYYADMFRHYGGMPILDHSLDVNDLEWPKRGTVKQTVDFIVGLLDDAINNPDYPWVLPEGERSNWDGRVTKASAAGLKLRVLLFAASPLFNSDAPYEQGQAASEHLTWYGDFQQSRWEDARKAGEDFFKLLNQHGYYKLVQKEDNASNSYRQAFIDGYFTRGVPESLISVRRNFYLTNDNARLDQSIRWGGYCPTKEYFDMFPMADGTAFDWDNPEHAKNPFINRDPRLNETILLDGDTFQGRTAEVYQKDTDAANWPDGRDWKTGQLGSKSLETGLAARKFALDRAGEFKNRPFHWPHLRLAEIYLSYAEALNECNRTPDAYQYVNAVRARVGLPGLSGLNKENLREAILTERALEFGWEEVRFFDLIRWKRKDIFEKKTHGLKIHKNKNTGEYKFSDYVLSKRAWWDGFEPKWYLSAFPADEVNKGYGMIQNPGWE